MIMIYSETVFQPLESFNHTPKNPQDLRFFPSKKRGFTQKMGGNHHIIHLQPFLNKKIEITPMLPRDVNFFLLGIGWAAFGNFDFGGCFFCGLFGFFCGNLLENMWMEKLGVTPKMKPKINQWLFIVP